MPVNAEFSKEETGRASEVWYGREHRWCLSVGVNHAKTIKSQRYARSEVWWILGGYLLGVTSERALVRELTGNLVLRWCVGLDVDNGSVGSLHVLTEPEAAVYGERTPRSDD